MGLMMVLAQDLEEELVMKVSKLCVMLNLEDARLKKYPRIVMGLSHT